MAGDSLHPAERNLFGQELRVPGVLLDGLAHRGGVIDFLGHDLVAADAQVEPLAVPGNVVAQVGELRAARLDSSSCTVRSGRPATGECHARNAVPLW